MAVVGGEFTPSSISLSKRLFDKLHWRSCGAPVLQRGNDDGDTDRYHDADLPRLCAVEGGDWIDLHAAERVEMKAGEFRIISLGISMKLPEGYEAHVVPRSSTFKCWGILQTNHMGVIDNAYCGDGDVWGFPALAMRDTVIEKGDRICQFRIVQKMEPVRFVEVDHLDGANRGGFGSTGAQ